MDLEAGRCRRTDGKKWRCSRDVLPDQKYCERHIHRGRQRSRKHVEVTEKVTQSIPPKTLNSKKTPKIIKPPNSANKVSNSSPQPPEVPQQIRHSSAIAIYKVCSAASLVSTTSPNILSNSKSSTVVLGSDVSPEGVLQSGVSPEGVLQSGVGHNTSTAALPETPLTENEPQRCRRTDGRKWRCSSDVVPTKKYCVQHIHRGVKKLTEPSNPITTAYSPPPLAIPKSFNMGPTTPGPTHGTLMSEDETSTSGSSSDATTITDDDENISDSSKYIIRARDPNLQTPF